MKGRTHCFSFNVEDGPLQGGYLVAEIAHGETVRQLFTELYKTVPPEVRSNARLIVRPTVKFQIDPTSIKTALAQGANSLEGRNQSPAYSFLSDAVVDIERAFQRFETHDIRVLGSGDYAHFLSENINPRAHDPARYFAAEEAALLERIRSAELDHLVALGMCKLPPLGNQHYCAPSGRFVRSFLRVGNLQVTRAAIDAIFFWLIPHLRNCVGIVTDTWSISSLSQNISRRLVDYAKPKRSPCPIEMLGDYHDNSPEYATNAAETIKGFVSRIGARNARDAKILLLISATHTGSMVKLLPEALEREGLPPDIVQYVSLFKLLPTSDITALRDLSGEPDFAPVELTDDQKRGAIRIHPKLYFPITPIDVEKRLLVDHAFPPYKAFLERYRDVDFARVHCTASDSTERGRHHAIWIDTEKLARHPAFQAQFRTKLLDLTPAPALIIHPDHACGAALARFAAEVLQDAGTSVVVRAHDHLRLTPEIRATDQELLEVLSTLPPERAILLLDDAFITGTRITAFQKNARRLPFKGTYHYLVALARPASSTRLRTQRNAFHRWSADPATQRKNSFDHVEKLILPDWGELDCPWCLEKELREGMGTTHDIPPTELGHSGLTTHIFTTPQGHPLMALEDESFVGPAGASQAAIYCAVAGGLQRLRTEKFDDSAPPLGSHHFMVSSVFASENYTRYLTDSVLVAAVWKAAKPGELTFTDAHKEQERCKLLKTFLAHPSNADLEGELTLAIAAGKIPHQVR